MTTRLRRLWRLLMQVLWPAYLAAAVASGLLFSMIDPHELSIVGTHLADSREAAYTIGFVLLWACMSFACGLTYVLAHDERDGDDAPTGASTGTPTGAANGATLDGDTRQPSAT